MWPSGNLIDLLDPDPSLIEIEDIAHHLSMIPRWSGGIRFPYSVAQHSIWCFQHVLGLELGFQALMHDATEAYINDVCTPLKKQLPNYQMIESRIWFAIAEKFGLPELLDERVKIVDANALILERMVLKSVKALVHPVIKYQHWTKTKRDFLNIFDMIMSKTGRAKEAEQIFTDYPPNTKWAPTPTLRAVKPKI